MKSHQLEIAIEDTIKNNRLNDLKYILKIHPDFTRPRKISFLIRYAAAAGKLEIVFFLISYLVPILKNVPPLKDDEVASKIDEDSIWSAFSSIPVIFEYYPQKYADILKCTAIEAKRSKHYDVANYIESFIEKHCGQKPIYSEYDYYHNLYHFLINSYALRFSGCIADAADIVLQVKTQYKECILPVLLVSKDWNRLLILPKSTDISSLLVHHILLANGIKCKKAIFALKLMKLPKFMATTIMHKNDSDLENLLAKQCESVIAKILTNPKHIDQKFLFPNMTMERCPTKMSAKIDQELSATILSKLADDIDALDISAESKTLLHIFEFITTPYSFAKEI